MSRPIKHILLATDFSPCSEEAAERAWYLANKLEAQLDVAHAWSRAPAYSRAMSTSGPPEEALKVLEEEARAGMAAFLEACRARDIHFANTLLPQGGAAEALVALAEEGHYDLIVAGTHGRSGVSRVLMGSVAEHILRHAPCPVLTVRHHEDE